MPDDDDDVLAANRAFYEAFRGDDIVAMDAVWARDTPVACVHPGWPPLLGRGRVMASWRGILSSGAPPIRAESPHVLRFGDAASVLCFEVVPGGRLAATNLFVREGGAWRMVHHHAGPVQIAEDAADDDSAPQTVN
jgi:ketosteroid isomerase-like protein